MTVGEFCRFVVRLDLDLGNEISPSSVLGVPFTTTSLFSSEARGRSCGLFSPSRCPLITSSDCTVLGEVVGGGRFIELSGSFQ